MLTHGERRSRPFRTPCPGLSENSGSAGQRATCSAHWIAHNGSYPCAASERIAATLRRTSGTSSASNHAFFLSQMLFRGLG